MKPGDVVLYVESPGKSYPALVLGVSSHAADSLGMNGEPILSLVYVPQNVDAKGQPLPPDPRLEGVDWAMATTRKGGILHASHESKAGMGIFNCWMALGEGEAIDELHSIRQQDASDVAQAQELTSGPALVGNESEERETP